MRLEPQVIISFGLALSAVVRVYAERQLEGEMTNRVTGSGASTLAVAALAVLGALTAAKGVAGKRQLALLSPSPADFSRTTKTKLDPHGRDAAVPEAIPRKGLRDVFWRVVSEVSDDRVLLVAAGVAFYLVLALFPGLTALVSLYGLIADPSQITHNLSAVSAVLPPGAVDIVSQQIDMLMQRKVSSLGLTFFFSLAIALWSSHSGILSVFDAMNIAYEEKEKRGLVRLNLIGIAFTLSCMIIAMIIVALIGIMPAIFRMIWIDQWTETMALVLRWPLLLILVFGAASAIYRFGPSRNPPQLRWLTWGAAFATLAWFLMSVGFSYYLAHFANYSATYGALGAMMGFLIWLWLSVAILIVGAELNAELEHQTAVDTTIGQPKPMGQRRAHVADTLGKTID